MIKAGYKITALGEIPEEWNIGVLGNMIEVLDSMRVPLSDIQREKNRGPIPYCGANGIIDYIDKYIFDDETVLVAEDGGSYGKYQDKAYIMVGKYWVNNHAHVFICKKGVLDNKFIMYWLNFAEIRSYISGTTRTKLNQEMLKKIVVPIIPYLEQKKIAKILSDTDALIESLDQLITKKKNIKQGLMHELLTRGIGHTRYKDTIIGRIPEEWVLSSLQESCELIKDGTHNPPKRIRSGIPLLSAINIENGKIDFHNNVTYIDEKDYKQINKFYSIKKGDVLITIVGTLGRLALVISDRKFSIQRSVAILRPHYNKVNNKYLFYILNSIKSQEQIIFYSKSTAQIGIYLGGLVKIAIPIPPLPEQQKIAKILSNADKEIGALEQKTEKYKMIKEGLMQELLTGKVRVK